MYLLLNKGHCYRSRIGKRKHNFIQGYTVDANWNILNLIIIRERERERRREEKRGGEERRGEGSGGEGRGGEKRPEG